jgi:hypothetical protein
MKDFDKHRRADLNDVLCKIAERGYVFVWTVYGSTKTRSCWKTGTCDFGMRPSEEPREIPEAVEAIELYFAKDHIEEDDLLPESLEESILK